MTAEAPSIRIVIPAYNEGGNIAALIRDVAAELDGSCQMIVVDDGSQDDTARAVSSLEDEFPVRIVTHPENRGLAAVFRTGIETALKDLPDSGVIVIMEGDGTSDPSLLRSLIKAISAGSDVAIASRYALGGCYKNFPIKRLLLSRMANWILGTFYAMPGVRDYTIFYRAYRAGPLRRCFQAYGERFSSARGFACNAEMLLRLRGFIGRVSEIPLVYDYGLKKSRSSMRISESLAGYAGFLRGLGLKETEDRADG